jgi:predicted dehydrogenase
MAGHLLLYQPAVQWIKNFLSSGGLGRPAYLVQERLKLGRVRAVESVLWSFGVHDVAVLLYLVGEAPRRVLAVGRRFLQSGVEDEAHLHLEFASGVQAHLHVSWLWPETRRRLTIVGSEAMLTYDELSREVTLYRKTVGPDLAARDGGQEVVFRGEGEPLLLECRHFLECVQTRRPPLSDGTGALAVVEVLERAQKQLEGGGPWQE